MPTLDECRCIRSPPRLRDSESLFHAAAPVAYYFMTEHAEIKQPGYVPGRAGEIVLPFGLLPFKRLLNTLPAAAHFLYRLLYGRG